MNITEIIRNRKSSRTFEGVPLKPEDKQALEKFIQETHKTIDDEPITLGIIEKRADGKKMKLDYGMISGHNTYLLGTSKSSTISRVNYGYLMEKVVLKATELGISTCWVGYFDSDYFNEIPIGEGYEIPGIVIVGYSKEKLTSLDKLMRFSVKASKRNDWTNLFFNYKSKHPLSPDSISDYYEPLEMVRLAPSAGNTQPWRVYFDNTSNEFHFFKNPISTKYEEKGLHDIDMGIALAHFELASADHNLSGSWQIKKDVVAFDNLQYIMTWKCEKQS